MKTKLLYVLTSNEEDTYYESALISIFSAMQFMPNSRITLLIDDKTDLILEKRYMQLMQFISEKVVVNFDSSISKVVRSRLLKTNMRNHVRGNFLYIDCDTLIADSLDGIDNIDASVAAVLDGHTTLSNHPVIDVFIEQNKYFGYPFNEIDKYFNSGVIFSKDCIEANDFFSLWHENYKNGLLKGVYQDQPSFSKTIYESKFNIQELNGEWNCQSRLGAKYLRNLKILHFVSKRNMPISLLDNKNFLLKLRREGLTSENKETVKNYESAFYSPMGIVVNDDLHFNFSPLYEEVRKFYVSTNTPYLFNIQEIHNNLYEKSIKSRMAKIFYKINKALFQIEVILIRSFSKPIEGE